MGEVYLYTYSIIAGTALLGDRQVILDIVRVPSNDQGLLSHVIQCSYSFSVLLPFFLCLYSSAVSHFAFSVILFKLRMH